MLWVLFVFEIPSGGTGFNNMFGNNVAIMI
jgi:hypothetical protein